jgi:DNA-binding transcriptional ArsR family regulator
MDPHSKNTMPQVTAQGEPLSDEAVEVVAAMLKVLADPNRLRLIELLDQRGSATVSALAACLPVCHAGVSAQLNTLLNAGVVRRRREGKWMRYELADFTGLWLVRQLASAMEPVSTVAA